MCVLSEELQMVRHGYSLQRVSGIRGTGHGAIILFLVRNLLFWTAKLKSQNFAWTGTNDSMHR